ncbi:MAG: F0F1 ATP synthase subunit B [Microcystaceae cyanobacterium]
MIWELPLILAMAEEAAEEGIGLNFDVLQTNLLNLAILIGVLVYFGSKVLGNILSERRTKIAEAIEEAQTRQKEAAAALAQEQEKLAKAQANAEKILQEADSRAEAVRKQILEQADADIERMKATADQDVSSQQDRLVEELKQRLAAMAIERVTGELSDRLDEDKQRRIIDRSIAQLGG